MNVWDGLSGNRDRFDDYVDPNGEDFDAIRGQLIATQNALNDANVISESLINGEGGDVTLNPLVTKGTDPSTTTIGDLFTITTKDIILAIGVGAVASKDLGYNIPAKSLVLSVAANIESTITLATATKVGIGVSGDLDKYGKITGGTKNGKVTTINTPTALDAGEDILIYAVDDNGDAAGTIAGGSIRVRIVIMTQDALPDAA